MKTFNMVKIILKTLKITSDRGLVLQFFEVTINLASIGVFGVFGIYGNQYSMGRVFSCPVISWSKFWQYLMLVSLSFSLDFCVCEYVDVEFLFLFDGTSAISLEM